MMRKIVGIGVVATLVAGLTLLAACDEEENGGNGTDPVDPCEDVTEITILSPSDGDTLTVGEAVTIDWCVPSDVSSVIVSYSANGGEDIDKISEGKSIEPDVATEMTWTPAAAATAGIIYVQNYNDQTGDYDQVSDLVVVAQ